MTTNTMNHEGLDKARKLLSLEEQAVLTQITAKEPPHSQRARALLAIDEGTTQAEAGLQAGLTKGQVRYWLTKFRANRIAIFPDELLIQAQQSEGKEDVPQALLKAAKTAGSADSMAVEQENTPKVKSKKSKRAKKPAKTKKSKKDKQASKGKTPKKKAKKEKKASKGKKSKKKAKKSKAQKTKGKKSKSSKKKRK